MKLKYINFDVYFVCVFDIYKSIMIGLKRDLKYVNVVFIFYISRIRRYGVLISAATVCHLILLLRNLWTRPGPSVQSNGFSFYMQIVEVIKDFTIGF